MRWRFLYLVLASALLHIAVLGLPFAVTTGTSGAQAMRPVRVHLLTDRDTRAAGTSRDNEASTAKAAVTAGEPVSTSNNLSPAGPLSTKEIQPATHSAQIEDSQRDNVRPSRRDALPITSPAPTRVALEKTSTRTSRVSNLEKNRRTEQKKPAKPRVRPQTAKTVNPSKPNKQEAHEQAPLRTTTVYPGLGTTQSSATNKAVAHNGVNPTDTGAPSQASAHQQNSQPSQRGRSTRVRYARIVKPDYPEQARAHGWEGTTILKVLVGRTGRSEQVRVHRTSGFNLLDDAAVNALQQWEFHPARHGPNSIHSWVNIPVVFKLKEAN